MENIKFTRGGAREGAGRPKEDNKKERRQYRASDSEYERIKELAAQHGMKTGEYIRTSGLNYHDLKLKYELLKTEHEALKNK